MIDTLGSLVSAASLVVSFVSVGFAAFAFSRTQRASIRPVLVFARTTKENWVLHNVGNGPALNVVVADGKSNGEWGRIVVCRPIAAGAEITLPWLQHGSRLAASYGDIGRRWYSTDCREYENIVGAEEAFRRLERTDYEFDLRRRLENRIAK